MTRRPNKLESSSGGFPSKLAGSINFPSEAIIYLSHPPDVWPQSPREYFFLFEKYNLKLWSRGTEENKKCDSFLLGWATIKWSILSPLIRPFYNISYNIEYVQLPQIANTKSKHVVTSDPNDWVVYTKVAKCKTINTEQFNPEMQKAADMVDICDILLSKAVVICWTMQGH